MGPYGSIWALMGPRCAHVGPFRLKGFCIHHLQVFVKRRGSHCDWQPVGTLCGCLVFFLTLEVIIHPKWQKSETNFKRYLDFCIWFGIWSHADRSDLIRFVYFPVETRMIRIRYGIDFDADSRLKEKIGFVNTHLFFKAFHINNIYNQYDLKCC